MVQRRLFLVAAAALAGCASAPPPATLLAPTGPLRVGVYPGSPTSLVGTDRGLTVELGQALARRLGVAYRQVEFPRLALVLDALKAGDVDFTITNATAVRAKDMDFGDPVVTLELGLLASPRSTLAAVDAMDEPGRRIGVAQGSSSQAALGARLQRATVVATPTLQAAGQMLASGEIDAFATNKGILFEMADRVPGARLLPGRWGTEHLAMAIPKGRDAALPELRRFAADARAAGWVQQAADRAGLRGLAPEGAR